MNKKTFGSVVTKSGATVEHSSSDRGPWSPIEPSPTTGEPLTLDVLTKAKAKLGGLALIRNVICVAPCTWQTISGQIPAQSALVPFSLKVRILEGLNPGSYFSVPEDNRVLQWSDDKLAEFLNAWALASDAGLEDFEED